MSAPPGFWSEVTDEHGGEHRKKRLMGETQAAKVGRLEPLHGVVLARCGVDWVFRSTCRPTGSACRTARSGSHAWGAGRLRCRDSQFLPKLADKALFRILSVLDMTARQVPHVGIPTASGASMTATPDRRREERPSRSGPDRSRQRRSSTAHSDPCGSAAELVLWLTSFVTVRTPLSRPLITSLASAAHGDDLGSAYATSSSLRVHRRAAASASRARALGSICLPRKK